MTSLADRLKAGDLSPQVWLIFRILLFPLPVTALGARLTLTFPLVNVTAPRVSHFDAISSV